MAEQETIFGKWAKERGIMESEMKRSISERIRQGMNDPEPEKLLKKCEMTSLIIDFG